MRTLFAGCVALFACASGTREAAAPGPAPTVAAESAPPKSEPPPAPKTTPEPAVSTAVGAPPPAGPAQSATQGPMTAAEAAAAVRAERQKGGAGDAAPPSPAEDACSSDADCVFTRLSPGACCPMLCAPRAVTKAAAEALESHVKTCAMTHACPQPACRAPPQVTYPACVQNKCVNKVRERKGEQ